MIEATLLCIIKLLFIALCAVTIIAFALGLALAILMSRQR